MRRDPISAAESVLERAAELVESSWTRKAQARDVNRKIVYPTSPTAVSWCATGALIKAVHDVTESYYTELMNKVYDLTCHELGVHTADTDHPVPPAITAGDANAMVTDWNDCRCLSGKELAGVFRGAARRLKAAKARCLE